MGSTLIFNGNDSRGVIAARIDAGVHGDHVVIHPPVAVVGSASESRISPNVAGGIFNGPTLAEDDVFSGAEEKSIGVEVEFSDLTDGDRHKLGHRRSPTPQFIWLPRPTCAPRGL